MPYDEGMLVRDLMKLPQVCGPADTLARAAQLLWENDCGVVPVVDEKQRIVGMLTDRDICMSAYTQGHTLGALPVHRAMAHAVVRCQPSQDVEAALRIMAEAQVHRLPVVDENDRLLGILSITDVLRSTQGKPASVRQRSAMLLMDALTQITGPRSAEDRPKLKTARKPASRITNQRPPKAVTR